MGLQSLLLNMQAMTGLAELVRKREVSPTELVEAAHRADRKAQNAPTISETQPMPNPKSIML
jgi:hypothetical protein